MSKIIRNPQGPLRTAELFQFGDVTYWDRTRPPTISKDSSDSAYTIRGGARSDFVATQELQSDQLAWVIMERQDQNGDPMRLWPNDWVPGRRIFIPSRDSLSGRGIV